MLARLAGSNSLVVRNITDINHPFTVTTVDYGGGLATFVGSDVLSAPGAHGLDVMPLSGDPKSTVVISCLGVWNYAWSPDAKFVTYVVETGFPGTLPWTLEWHLAGGGSDRLIGHAAPSCHCDGEHNLHFSFDVAFSPDGRYVSLVEDIPGGGDFQVRRVSDGSLVSEIGSSAYTPAPPEFTTLGVWDGRGLYFRDSKGIEAWRDGAVSSVLAGLGWTEAAASPAGGQIVFGQEDSRGLHHPSLLDTKTGAVKSLTTQAGVGYRYLAARYLWYAGERSCRPEDNCVFNSKLPTGKTYILDLVTGVESESRIAQVLDVWPHGA
ncbi:MAG TPA: hypothetical protein VLR46_14650 [Candidatus Dormibacteraeota bacterium]|nr:hypothetical protein [Candidatus Dormibacteraeota bacterium]